MAVVISAANQLMELVVAQLCAVSGIQIAILRGSMILLMIAAVIHLSIK